MKSAATCPTAVMVNTYERLRSACLEARSPLAGELGLTVLLRHGMLAWSRTCQPVLGGTRPCPTPLDTARVPSPLHTDIVNVMVAMATGLSRSAHHAVPQA
jgi:hypothetical protein